MIEPVVRKDELGARVQPCLLTLDAAAAHLSEAFPSGGGIRLAKEWRVVRGNGCCTLSIDMWGRLEPVRGMATACAAVPEEIDEELADVLHKLKMSGARV